jgi:hypothetical protein
MMTNDKDSAVLADKSDEYAIGHLSALLEVELHENGHTIGEDLAEKLAEIAVKTVRQPTQSDALREALGSVIALLDTQAEPPKSVVSVQDYARWANARIGLGLVMIAPRLRAALQEQSK